MGRVIEPCFQGDFYAETTLRHRFRNMHSKEGVTKFIHCHDAAHFTATCWNLSLTRLKNAIEP